MQTTRSRRLPALVAVLAAQARLQVTSAAGGPEFVGIAPTEDVERYLAGTEHATLTDLDTSPFRATTETVPGDRIPADPATQDIWSASMSGTGTTSLEWDRGAESGCVPDVRLPARPETDPMTSTASSTTLRELDARTNDGLDIRLLWRPHDDVVLLQVDDAELHLRLVVPVPPDDAMFAFHHPFAFAETVNAAEQVDAPVR